MSSLVKADIVARIVETERISREQALEAVRVLLERMKATLLEGGRIELRGFGVFEVRARRRGMGRNPKTGLEVPIPPGRSVRFKPGRDLRIS